ncbi:MAG: hypothetical protein IJ408_06515 [Clostridia bacterium]|nr:hypothetical protein [Clostridia bacterium]
MIDDYKKAMDRVKTDSAYKANFLEAVNEKHQKQKKHRFMPIIKYVSTAAAVLLVVYCTSIFFIKQPEDASMKMSPSTEYEGAMADTSKPRSSANVIYFTFDGFEEYDVSVESRAVLLNGFEENYTVANLLSDYYPLIVGEDGSVEIKDGMVDNFLNVSADSEKEINVYVNDREVLNLEQKLVSECIESEDNVYFKVTVEN